ncbi:MAG: DUF6491 family protein [Steroidobacteraceae bacterium]
MRRIATLALLVVPALAACATEFARKPGEDGRGYADYAGAPVDRVVAWDIDGWAPVSRDSLVVWTRPGEAYLVKVWNSCQDLQFVEHVGISTTNRSLSKFEHVRVGRQRCPIETIRPIDLKQMQADRAAARPASK